MRDFHNNCRFPTVCSEVIQSLKDGGLDDRLANHIASLFIRSPIPVYEKELAFPCCQKEQAEEILERLNAKESPAKAENGDTLTPVKTKPIRNVQSLNNMLQAAADQSEEQREEVKTEED